MSLLSIIAYTTPSKKKPFVKSFATLDSAVQAVVLGRLKQVSTGNFGDCRLLKNKSGIWEPRIHHGSGYRIYFVKEEYTLIILLVGGDEGSQSQDIVKAERHWLKYKESKS